MSLTLNMVGGGGGGLSAPDALLRVQAPAGSTVTITKGTTTKTDLGHENADDHTVYDYYFIIHQSQFDSVNAWTVTATLSGDTASDTIIIDAADEYDVELSYYVYLFKDGDLCTAITGGWVGSYTNLQNNWSVSDGKMNIGTATAVGTVNKINTADYSTIVFVGKGLTHSGSQATCSMGLYNARNNTNTAVTVDTGSETGDFTKEIDITNYNGEYYPTCRVGNGSTGEYYRVYLKK